MKKIRILFSVTLLILFGFILIIRINNSYYSKKFENILAKSKINDVKKEWGIPDEEYICKDCDNNIVLKYRKDITGWNTYVFVFDKTNNLLVKKTIDD